MEKHIFLSGIELLKVFNLIMVSNQSPLITWQGPDIINFINFKAEDFYELAKTGYNVKQILNDYIQLEETEIFNREIIYWRVFFKGFLSDDQIKELQNFLVEKYVSMTTENIQQQQQNPKQFGYAILQSD